MEAKLGRQFIFALHMHRILTVFLSFILALAGNSQSEMSFRHYSVAEGLSDNFVRCVHFDQRGFMWIGTNEGLNRFDGEEFIAYRKISGNANSLSGNVVTDIAEEPRGTLWIATKDGGVCRLDQKTGLFRHPLLIRANGEETKYVHSIALSGDRIYVGSYKGIFTGKKTDEKLFCMEASAAHACNDIIKHSNGKLYSGSVSTSVSELEGDSIYSFWEKKNTHFPFAAFAINDLLSDENGQLWAGGWDNYLHRYHTDSHTIESFDVKHENKIDFENDEIYCIEKLNKEEILIAYKSNTFWKFNVTTHASQQVTIATKESGKLRGKRINCMLLDNLNRL